MQECATGRSAFSGAGAAGEDANLDLHAGWQAEALVEGLDGLAGRLEDVDEALVRADLELLARLAIDVRAAQHRVSLDAGRQRDGAVDDGLGLLGRADDLQGRT